MKNIVEDIETGKNPNFIDPGKRGRINRGELGYEPLMPKKETTHEIATAAYGKAMDSLRSYIPANKLPKSKTAFIRVLMGSMVTLQKIKEIENKHIEYLEMLAVETVLNLPEFASVKRAVDAGDIRIEPELVSGALEVDVNEIEKEIEMELENEDFDTEMELMLADMDQEKLKRRFSNIMIQGAASSYLYLFEYVKSDLTRIDSDLPGMYGFMCSVGEVSYWAVPECNLCGNMSGGEERIDQEEGVIKAKGLIFPILIHEIIKGLMEYTTSHGLPSNPVVAQNVMAAVDTNENEIYDLMLGPIFWRKLTNSMDPDKVKLLFHVWNRIVSLPAIDPDIKESFAHFIKEFLKDPESAKRIIQSVTSDVQKAIDLYEKENEPGFEDETPTNEGLISRALGTAALAGALGVSSPSEAGQHKKYMNPTELQNIKQRIQLNIITRTLWAEARGNGEEGMRAVASVIYNRGKGDINAMIEAIKKPKQFSCWNSMTKTDWLHFKEKEREGKEWDIATKIANEMIRGSFVPITSATHYYNPRMARPKWAYAPNGVLRPNDTIGIHRFMKIDDYTV